MTLNKKLIGICAIALAFAACDSSTEEQKLPDLPKIEVPKTIAGEYVGRVPPEDAKARQIRVTLDSTGVGVVTENILRDTVEVKVDTIAYENSGEVLSFKFKGKVWNFKKNGDFGYVFLNPQGEPYLDAAGSNFALLRMLKTPEKK